MEYNPRGMRNAQNSRRREGGPPPTATRGRRVGGGSGLGPELWEHELLSSHASVLSFFFFKQ